MCMQWIPGLLSPSPLRRPGDEANCTIDSTFLWPTGLGTRTKFCHRTTLCTCAHQTLFGWDWRVVSVIWYQTVASSEALFRSFRINMKEGLGDSLCHSKSWVCKTSHVGFEIYLHHYLWCWEHVLCFPTLLYNIIMILTALTWLQQ